jgi:hypothetical protein
MNSSLGVRSRSMSIVLERVRSGSAADQRPPLQQRN